MLPAKEIEELIESEIHRFTDECDELTKKMYNALIKLVSRCDVLLVLKIEEIFIENSGILIEMSYRKGFNDRDKMSKS
jgi:hypothetical protein